MSAPSKGTSGNASISSGPINGSFPVDRLHECSHHIQTYFQCLQKHNNYASMCKKETRMYLECRRDNGLMTKRDFRDADVELDGGDFIIGGDDDSLRGGQSRRASSEGVRDFEEWRRKREINKRLDPQGTV
uniref:CHCH domain-containing protein n=1 Tax=Percolomonas cosmopolitus TaxID=63605 RepID=A0A7S1KUC5_9EUKA|mmetsp:Transcript_9954/g.37123  ORF Transcript_9954/g.37123 Transcript_9954/m.37123 type:complete len:131 (+) Transcript_9954:308-700(+)|eukprot:CAMPEP_0117450126 /NCGR_PEP_ID=MMETSP0759-20121206/8303_1 /TAXON_ID=63605 /ORGANISM="Percolomonas cosmopolitus, Strain WS" /LENGTH=130 /DNA_ID=CAMNT_0005242629 /DNA_START=128 /DNA_END=520 /DNA_ORIENTATION=-